MNAGVTVVTGASNGIGQAIAQSLLADGQTVVNIDRQAPDWSHARMIHYAADLSDQSDIERVGLAIAQSHAVTALVNNAGATRPGSIDQMKAADLNLLCHLHLLAPALLTQAFLPTLRASGCGRIVNLATRAALGKAERVAYAATKAGLVGLTRTLAIELGGDGITVNAVAPGPIATELFMRSNPPDAPATKQILQSIKVGRMGTPDDVARGVRFFLSPDNGFITGQVLYVCGGTTLGTAPG